MLADFDFPRVQAIPQIQRASFRLNGVEKVAYEFGLNESRPFFYPLLGPSGAELTRMGHPNPVGHEHHKSIWFAHQYVIPGGRDISEAVNFWEEPAIPPFASATSASSPTETATTSPRSRPTWPGWTMTGFSCVSV